MNNQDQKPYDKNFKIEHEYEPIFLNIDKNDEEEIYDFQNLSQITLLFGKNSSGKSSFLNQVKSKFADKAIKLPFLSIADNLTSEETIVSLLDFFNNEISTTNQEITKKVFEFYNMLNKDFEKIKSETVTKLELISKKVKSKFPNEHYIQEFNKFINFTNLDASKIKLFAAEWIKENSLENLSTGTIRYLVIQFFLEVLAEFKIKKGDHYLLIDEIENSFHPSRLQEFIAILKNIVKKNTNIKIVITTHSPLTLFYFASQFRNKHYLKYFNITKKSSEIEYEPNYKKTSAGEIQTKTIWLHKVSYLLKEIKIDKNGSQIFNKIDIWISFFTSKNILVEGEEDKQYFIDLFETMLNEKNKVKFNGYNLEYLRKFNYVICGGNGNFKNIVNVLPKNKNLLPIKYYAVLDYDDHVDSLEKKNVVKLIDGINSKTSTTNTSAISMSKLLDDVEIEKLFVNPDSEKKVINAKTLLTKGYESYVKKIDIEKHEFDEQQIKWITRLLEYLELKIKN